jgi:glucokinase
LGAQQDRFAVGIDLGGTTFAIGHFAPGGSLIARQQHETPSCEGADCIADAIASAVHAGIEQRGADTRALAGVAIGFPGPVDPDAGVVKMAPNIHQLTGYPLSKELSRRLDGPAVHLQNDAYCATLAELRWGAGREVDNLLMFTLGTGVGGGVALNNRVIRGPRQILGEVGHLIIDPGGRLCGCGNYGCLEAVAARDGIIDLARRAMQSGRPTLLTELVEGDQDRLTPHIVAQASAAGDPAAVEVYQQVGFYIGIALCNCIVLCDPDLVVIGGGIAAAGDCLLEPIRRTVAARSLISGFDVARIVPAQYGNDAGMYGAGALAWEHA